MLVKCPKCPRTFRGKGAQTRRSKHLRQDHPVPPLPPIPEDRQLPAPCLDQVEEVIRTMTNTDMSGFITAHINDLGTNMVGLLQFYLILSQAARDVSDRLRELLTNDFPQIT